jgi:RNA polymerase sigma-70 factor (ECF subfamily)
MGDKTDEIRFRRLYREHYERLLAYAARRCSSPSEAHDVVADTFLVLWRRLGDAPHDDREVPPWLYGVARRVLSNRYRAQQRQQHLAARIAQSVAQEREVDEVVTGNTEARIVLAAMGKLNDGDREVLLLAAWERLSAREIAVVLGCSENAAAIRVHRARQRLRQEVEKETASAGDKESVGLRRLRHPPKVRREP